MVRGNDSWFCFGPFRLNAEERLLMNGAAAVPLEAMPLNLLLALVENAGHLMTRDELIAALWPRSVVLEHGLTVYMCTLRKALDDTREAPRYIQTVRSYGYRFIAPVTIEKQHLHQRSLGESSTHTEA